MRGRVGVWGRALTWTPSEAGAGAGAGGGGHGAQVCHPYGGGLAGRGAARCSRAEGRGSRSAERRVQKRRRGAARGGRAPGRARAPAAASSPRRPPPPRSPLPRPEHRPRCAPRPIRGRRPQPRALQTGAASSSVSESRCRCRRRTGFLRPLRPVPAARAGPSDGRDGTRRLRRPGPGGGARRAGREEPPEKGRGGGGDARRLLLKGEQLQPSQAHPPPPRPGPQAPAREKPRVRPRPALGLLDRRLRRSATPLQRYPRRKASRAARVSGP